MARKLMGRLVVASHNQGKLKEMRELLTPFNIEVVSAAELNLPEPDETGTTFAENAAIKAHAAAKVTGLPAFADDSGLCIEALDCAPGIFSARWAGPSKNFPAAISRIERELAVRGVVDDAARRAHFVSALVVAWPDGHEELFEGRVFGTLVIPGRGDKGFGYDPIFRPDGHEMTFGEMTSEEKHGRSQGDGLSHRARAFKKLSQALLD